jgi:phage terminase small subunit
MAGVKKALTPAQKKRAATLRASKAEAARRERFCIEYVFNTNNGTQAYLKINPKVTPETAATAAWRLLRTAEIQKRIDELQTENHDELIADHKRILREVSDMALFDPVNMFDADGRLLTLDQMDPTTRKSVNEIEMIISDEDGTPFRMAKVKYGKDKRGYTDMMMKHYNQYEAHRVAGSVQPITLYLHEADQDL